MFSDQNVREERAKTRLAEATDRAESATRAWAEVQAKSTARDENIVRLKAARLARDAQLQLVVAGGSTSLARNGSGIGGMKKAVRSKKALSKQ